jgi:DNA-directed RNA polymerase subunit RPC12/RpoP
MARTPGSGWGAGPITRHYCCNCGKKGAYHDYMDSSTGLPQYRCMYCKARMDLDLLVKYAQENKLRCPKCHWELSEDELYSGHSLMCQYRDNPPKGGRLMK